MAESIRLKGNKYWDVSAIHGLIDAIYPVGSIYLSVNNVNPGTLFGGTWEAYGAADTYLRLGGNGSGGSNAVKLAANQIPSLTTGNNSATHTHKITVNSTGVNSSAWASNYNDGPLFAGLNTSAASNPSVISGSNVNKHVELRDGSVITDTKKYTSYLLFNMAHAHSASSVAETQKHTHTYTNNSQQNVTVEPKYVQTYAWKRTA